MHLQLLRALSWAILLAGVSTPARDTGLTCAQILLQQPGQGQLLGVVVGGRATGNYIPVVAHQLGYKIVHIYPSDLPGSIIGSFTHEYDFPAITYTTNEELDAVQNQLSEVAHRSGLSVAGFVTGMDYGAAAADWLAEGFQTPTNGRQWMEMRNDKELMNAHLASRQVPVAKAFSLTPAEALAQVATLPYPLFGKARRSFASVGSAPIMDLASLPAALAQIQQEADVMKVNTEQIFFEQLLSRDRIYFADTAHAEIDGNIVRITTGVWIDYRGTSFDGEAPRKDDFPKQVWDYIEMMPPPHLLDAADRELFHLIVQADRRMSESAELRSGTTHTEYMSPYPIPRSVDELFPTDVNPRLPGLRAPSLEERATGVSPFMLDILSRTQPHYLRGMPLLYSTWEECVALIFLRAYEPGIITEQGRRWLEQRYVAPGATPPAGKAYLSDILVPAAGTEAKKTVNGTTMVGTLHVAGPTRESIRQLLKEIRTLERAGFFVRPH